MKALKILNPLKVSAMFAAYVWFTERKGVESKPQAEARAFARENWEAFLPNANPGLGRLLLDIAKAPKRAGRRPMKRPGAAA